MKHTVDILKEGEDREKLVYIEVDGKQIGTIYLYTAPGRDPRDHERVIVTLGCKYYKLEKLEQSGDSSTIVTLSRSREEF